MEQAEPREDAIRSSPEATPAATVAPIANTAMTGTKPPPAQQDSCPTCGAAGATMLPSYVYAIGRIEPRFPRLSVEKEFAHATGRAETTKLTEHQTLRKVLEENRYLVRHLCWVMSVGGLETYILLPRDPADYHLLVEALRSSSRPGDVDLVIGMRGPLASPDTCNGLIVPIVAFDQLYSFDRDLLIRAIEKPVQAEESRFRESAAELFDRIMQLTDNAGATDEHRALNYLAVRYPAIYARVYDAHEGNLSLTAVDVRPSPLSGLRKIVEVIFSFRHRIHDVVEKQFARVDVTEEFPFLVTKLSPYYDR